MVVFRTLISLNQHKIFLVRPNREGHEIKHYLSLHISKEIIEFPLCNKHVFMQRNIN